MVPEQTRQDQEVDGLKEPPRPAADGPRAVQPYNGTAHQRGGGARDAHERPDTVSSSCAVIVPGQRTLCLPPPVAGPECAIL